jgi:protein gp37
MQPTNIGWATDSHNPQTGCSRAGPICYDPETGRPKCYAEIFSRRQDDRTDQPWTVANASENVTMHPERIEEIHTYHYPERPARVFIGSMTDMFYSQTDPGFVQDVLDACGEHLEHEYIWLTKRPHNAAEWRLEWPPNCWLGVSVGSAGRDYPSTTHRIEQLRDVDVATKWVSFEPLLEPLGELALDHIDWAVVGGETDTSDEHRREMEHEWAVDILRQCREQDVAYFFKQSSGRYPDQGTRLSIYNEERGIYEQRRIQEYPEPHPAVAEARAGDSDA